MCVLLLLKKQYHVICDTDGNIYYLDAILPFTELNLVNCLSYFSNGNFEVFTSDNYLTCILGKI